MGIPFGRYQLLKKIASGGMGQVLLAKKGQDDFEKLIVLKRILPHLVEDEEFFTMFRDEAKITMRLDHPNIARINEFGVEAGVHYIEMEYVAGEDVRRIEKRAAAVGKGIPIGVILKIIADAAAGLDFAHKARDAKGVPLGLVHRDVSPQNVLIGFDGSVKLIDFGVAKAAGRAQHTATGILKGKFPYMSPEQAQGEELDCRSDVFALGIVLWEQLTGRRLFKGENDLATQRLVRACQVPAPSSVEPSVPTGLDPITLKALSKDPKDRYQDAAELRNALEDFALQNAIPTSSSSLAAFMQDLYAERIAKEADPRFFEEDSGLTDLDVGGLSKPQNPAAASTSGATVVDRNKLPAGNATQVVGTVATQVLSPPVKSSSPLPKVIGGVVLMLVLAAGGWFATRTPEVTPVAELPPKPVTGARPGDTTPPPAVEPLLVHIVSEPLGANVELAGSRVGQTPFDARVEKVKLPVALRLSAEGYESAEATLTDMTGPNLSLSLKKKVAVVKQPTGGSGGKNPDIKTTR
jgi:serine/threonine protein kinase